MIQIVLERAPLRSSVVRENIDKLRAHIERLDIQIQLSSEELIIKRGVEGR